jgi:hypothetical protein
MQHYFSGIAVGVILIQTAVVAPSMFRTLDIKDFGRAIRVIWPKFFLVLAATGLGMSASVALTASPGLVQSVIAGATLVLPLICYAIVPATNRATDTGDHARFALLHRISVGLTVTVLVTNIAFAFV